jgi:hypothetical protein
MTELRLDQDPEDTRFRRIQREVDYLRRKVTHMETTLSLIDERQSNHNKAHEVNSQDIKALTIQLHEIALLMSKWEGGISLLKYLLALNGVNIMAVAGLAFKTFL